MNKADFLNELYTYLSPLKHSDKEEIIKDFQEHFREGLAAGKSEEQICSELGSPLECARQYVGDAIETNTAKKPSRLAKPVWTAALIVNIIEAIIAIPLMFIFILVDIVLIVAACYLIPAVSFPAFTVFMISVIAGVFIAALMLLLVNLWEISIISKQIKENRGGQNQ